MLRRFSGASVRRVVDRSHAQVPEHAHDWPLLSVFVIGSYANRTELGESVIAEPSAILYRAGAPHRNIAGPAGFEQIEIEFDPAWLRDAPLPDAPVSQWRGGSAAAQSRALASLCNRAVDEGSFRETLLRFFGGGASRREPPDWIAAVTQRLRADTSLSIGALAQDARRHPSWLGTAYRRATGEGLQDTATRFRVERAAHLLRETDRALADIAAEAGFCDQSHMNRSFRRVLGRLPTEVRKDRQDFRQACA